MTGLETALPIVHELMVASGAMTWDQVAAALSARPAAIGRLTGQGRPLAVGEPANLTLFDPRERWTVDPAALETASPNTPVAGREMHGRVRWTWLRGRATVSEGTVVER
jgi:dihydroorotase